MCRYVEFAKLPGELICRDATVVCAMVDQSEASHAIIQAMNHVAPQHPGIKVNPPPQLPRPALPPQGKWAKDAFAEATDVAPLPPPPRARAAAAASSSYTARCRRTSLASAKSSGGS